MSKQDNQVVVAFDFSHSGREALYSAVALAKRDPNNVLHFVYVMESHAGGYQEAERMQQALVDEVRPELEQAQITDQVHFFVHARIGKPADEILDLAREVGADLIIIGTKGLTGVEHLFLGSVAEKVVREAGCAVSVVRRKKYDYVPRLEIKEVTAHQNYIPPHRYSYEENRIELRPLAWPLY